jgi:predicted ATP-grasp superfamily ATP-dependent carboligase
VSRSYLVPREGDSRRFLDRLLAIGSTAPGRILLPTSDETAWLYTENASLLGEFFRIYQPSVTSMRRILDKKLLADAATSAGLTTLPSWEPQKLEEVAALAPSLPYPVLIKPRTHVHRLRNDKGIVVRSALDLVHEFQRFISREGIGHGTGTPPESCGLPILQQFVSLVDEGICSVSGFIDRTGELFVTRCATKTFQRSQPVGVGVCFDSLPTDPVLSDAVRRLCLELEYFGIFEVEFLRFNGDWAIIDFNPRLFNQIGLDIMRGMPLPLIGCLAAANETTALQEVVTNAKTEQENESAVFCDRFTLRAILMARALTGRISRKERTRWRTWMERNAACAVDLAKDDGDPMPAIIHGISEIYLGIKAIPRFLRVTPRVSSQTARVSIEAQS